MKHIKYYLLFTFLTMSLALSAQLKEFEIKEMPAPAGIAITMDHPDCAQLVIHSELNGLRFESNMAGIREQRHSEREDKYLVFITNTRQIITVKAKGFIEQQLSAPLELKAKERKYYAINEKKLSDEEGKGHFILDSVPSGAQIKIDGFPSFNERTPYRFRDYLAMSYSLSLSLEGYDDYKFIMKIVADQEGRETVQLRANFAELTIDSTPEAKLYLDGEYKGVTPQSLEGIKRGLKPGNYKLKLTKERHDPHEEIIVLKADEKQVRRYILNPKYTEIDIKSEPSQSAVYLNDKYLGRTPLQFMGIEKALDSGEHTIKLIPSSSVYNTIEKPIEFFGGALFLETFIHEDQRCWLKLNVKEKPYAVYINEKRMLDLESGREVLLDSGDFKLTVEYTGKGSDKYPPYHKDLSIAPGEHRVEEVIFNPYKALVSLNSDYRGVRLKIIDKDSDRLAYKGLSGNTINLFPGSYTVKSDKFGFHNKETDIVVRELPGQSFEFNPIFNYNKPKFVMAEMLGSIGTFAALGGAALYSKQKSDDFYEEYLQAIGTSEVEKLRKSTKKWDNYTAVFTGAEILATAWLTRSVVNFIRIKVTEKEVKRLQRFDSGI